MSESDPTFDHVIWDSVADINSQWIMLIQALKESIQHTYPAW